MVAQNWINNFDGVNNLSAVTQNVLVTPEDGQEPE